jgi:tetratricopeptide (TPR) repeat protein
METNKQPKIALAMIVKDDSEVDELRRAIKSVINYVDGIFITGTKNPQTKVKKLCKEVGATWSWFEWCLDFSKARNFNFAQVPKEYDWIIWMDTDDVWSGAEKLREWAVRGLEMNMGAIFARYLYSVELDEKGGIKNILIEHLRERIIRNNDNYQWVAPIHETLIPKVPANQTDAKDFMVVHLTDFSAMERSMYRNIEILEEEVINNSTDPRPIYYLAKAYFDTRDPLVLYEPLGEGVESITIELIKQYLATSGWAEERAQACEYLSMIYREMGEYDKALRVLNEAQLQWPQYPSIYIQLALCYVMKKEWSKALHWIKIATNIEMPKTTLVIQPKDYKLMILECLFHIHFNTQNLELTSKVIDELSELQPTEQNISRKKDVDDWKLKNELAHAVIKLANYLKNTGQKDRLLAMVDAIPEEIEAAPALIDMRNSLIPPKTWAKDEITIYCGPGFEKWSPENAKNGIGGSEEAVIYLSQELKELGWKVTVFGDPENPGMYDGVLYLPSYYVNWNDSFNVFIGWRNIGVFDLPLKTAKAYLWNHDIQNPLTYTPERLAKIDKVFFLSKWHRDNVPKLPEDKVMYTANGINI